jgi:hypothetical protein
MRPREHSIPISHADIGETNTGAAASNEPFMACVAALDIGCSSANQIAAQVSSNNGASAII